MRKPEQVRCPVCNCLGSKFMDGYCKNHYPDNPKNNQCVQCGGPAFRRNDAYEGCIDDWYCREHYEDRCGPVLDDIRPDYRTPSLAPPCEQCGQPAWKKAHNGYNYCETHYKDRLKPTEDDRHVFNETFKDKIHSDTTFIPEDFGIIKDKIGYAER